MKTMATAIVAGTLAILATCGSLWAQAKPAPAKLPYTGQWTVISDEVLASYSSDAENPDKFAAKTAGIGVDRVTGDVYMMANARGIWKSTDQGKKFESVSGKDVTGRCETGWGINVDPAGKRLMCFTIYGSCAYSPDAGKTWIKSKEGHLDYGAIDWGDTGLAMLAVVHESGGKLLFTTDAGKEWKTLGKGYSATGIFNAKALLTSGQGGGIVRSADGGTEWKKVSEEKLAAPVMVVFKKVGYWLGENGLLVSEDEGATWKVKAEVPKGACLGPMFGKDETHMVVGAPDGLYESRDAGKTWALAVPLAPEIKILKRGIYGNYAWDPVNNIFYASNMAKPAYKFAAGGATTAPAATQPK